LFPFYYKKISCFHLGSNHFATILACKLQCPAYVLGWAHRKINHTSQVISVDLHRFYNDFQAILPATACEVSLFSLRDGFDNVNFKLIAPLKV
jgi:hypothetical protein